MTKKIKKYKYDNMHCDEVFWVARDILMVNPHATDDVGYIFELAKKFYDEGISRGHVVLEKNSSK